LLPGRVARVAVLGCAAPDDDPNFDVTAGMPEINRESLRMLRENPEDDRLTWLYDPMHFPRPLLPLTGEFRPSIVLGAISRAKN